MLSQILIIKNKNNIFFQNPTYIEKVIIIKYECKDVTMNLTP